MHMMTTPTTSNEPTYLLVTQVKSNRVVYFTDDLDYLPPQEGDWNYISTYQGKLPAQMTLKNCWGWRFNGGVFTDAREPKQKSQKEALIDHNRQALLRMVKEKINTLRAPFEVGSYLGEEVRRKKLKEAQTFTEHTESLDSYPFLEAVAVARDISMSEAAQLVLEQASKTDEVLIETERIRETFNQKIMAADSEEVLVELRRQLLNEVYPALSEKFKFKVDHITPTDPNKPLPLAHIQHEILRLQVQLREKINRIRADYVSLYLLDDVLVKHKANIAELMIKQGGKLPEDVDISLLTIEAEAKNISVLQVARDVLLELAETGRVLIETEKVKNHLLSKIARLKTISDINQIGEQIKSISVSP